MHSLKSLVELPMSVNCPTAGCFVAPMIYANSANPLGLRSCVDGSDGVSGKPGKRMLSSESYGRHVRRRGVTSQCRSNQGDTL